MADNYTERLDADQALSLLRLSALIRETCADYAISQPGRKVTGWRDKAFLGAADVRRPTRPTLERIAAQLGLPVKVVDRWIADQPDAVAGER